MAAKRKPEHVDRESKHIDFKEQFDIGSRRDWCELIKDFVSIANSGGGSIVVGLKNDGTPSEWDSSLLLALDSAKVVDRLAPYTGVPYGDFKIRPGEKAGKKIAVIDIEGARVPMVFVRPGEYEVTLANGKQQKERAFAAGTLYFRHGAKSEPAEPSDLRALMERESDRTRKQLLGNIKKLAYVPIGHEIRILPKITDDPTATPFRLVDDPEAPAIRGLDPNRTHPHRAMELVGTINEKLKGKKKINIHDIRCIKEVHKIGGTKPHFLFKPKYGATQYSDAFVGWVVDQFTKNPRFFDKARTSARRLKRGHPA